MLPKTKGDICMGKLSIDLYLANISKRYKAANKIEKGRLLNELCESSGFHKKHTIRLLNSSPKKRTKKQNQGRPKIYPESDYLLPLKRIWLLSDQILWQKIKNCSTTLVASLWPSV
jgi:hypothetical protein